MKRPSAQPTIPVVMQALASSTPSPIAIEREKEQYASRIRHGKVPNGIKVRKICSDS